MKKNIPFNDTSRTFSAYREPLIAQITKVAESGWWLLGKGTRQFSQVFAKYCGSRYCLPVANGSDALELALRAILPKTDSNEEHEVITVANAGGYSTTACRLVGAIPVYADIEKNNQLICADSLVNCLGPKVKVVIATHLYGGVVDITKIRSILDQNGYGHVAIIEDCAQAHGGILAGCRVGSLGDLATFSFYPTKNLGAMGDAGAILTSDKSLYHRLNALHQYGWNGKYKVEVAYGRNSRMDEMQATILEYLLPKLDEFNQKRKEIYEKYRRAANLDFGHFCALAEG
jgi:aminotransferase EvaB